MVLWATPVDHIWPTLCSPPPIKDAGCRFTCCQPSWSCAFLISLLGSKIPGHRAVKKKTSLSSYLSPLFITDHSPNRGTACRLLTGVQHNAARSAFGPCCPGWISMQISPPHCYLWGQLQSSNPAEVLVLTAHWPSQTTE